MKIGIIGSGVVGKTLARAFKNEGHDVVFGTRDTSKEDVVAFKKENSGIGIGTFEEAARFGELLVLCTKGKAASNAIKLAGIDNLANKVVIDTTNPIEEGPLVNGVLKYFTDINHSLMEDLQQQAPGARFVKAFSSVGNARMYKPSFKDGIPTMFICGNDEDAKKTVTQILGSFGWETEDMGKAEAARAIEPLCMLWCIPGFLRNQWTHAFKLLR